MICVVKGWDDDEKAKLTAVIFETHRDAEREIEKHCERHTNWEEQYPRLFIVCLSSFSRSFILFILFIPSCFILFTYLFTSGLSSLFGEYLWVWDSVWERKGELCGEHQRTDSRSELQEMPDSP